MPHSKQATTIFFLILFLQAFQLCTSKGTTPSTLIPPQTIDKELLLGEPITGNTYFGSEPDDVPEFDAEFHLDTNPGDESDPESSYKTNKKTGVDANSGYDTGYESDPELDKNNICFAFEPLMQSMLRAADDRRNIMCHISGDKLTRSVGSNSGNANLYTPEDYVVIALNIYRAAKMIFELYKIPENKSDNTSKKAYELMQYYDEYGEKKSENSWIKTIKNINSKIVLYLKDMIFKDKSLDWINERLRLAENYVGLDDTHYNVTTTFTIAGKKFALEDKKWLKLTENQQQAYINRKSEKWYKRLELFEQKLIDHYWSKIVDGNHYIPTQLRNIPGCRNAYQKRIWTYDENNNPIVLGSYHHSGSIVSPIEWEDKATDFQISKDNWEQIKQYLKNAIKVSLNYNKNLPYFKQCQEKKIVQDTEKVVGSDQFMNISVNPIGTSSHVYEKYSKLVEYIVKRYKQHYPEVCKSFKDGLKDKRFFIEKLTSFKENPRKYRNKKIEQIKDPKDKKFFELLVELEKYTTTSPIWNNLKQSTSLISGNPNATACAIYIALMAVLKQYNKAIPSILFSCKSGKDRTGLISLLVDAYIILISCPKLTQDEIIKALICSGHFQLLAANNGGMPGRSGLKSVQSDEIPNSHERQLFSEAAKHTYIDLINNPKDLSEMIRNDEKQYEKTR